ncbi:MAG: universal stress protein family-domain-containing protein [Monoraphidium minutum]|nr:MAG: universal stress protein family-domain-containing protein [Monoraphidium minutum]
MLVSQWEAGWAHEAPGAPRVVLIPVQDDELSERVFGWAVANELRPGDAVHIVHVIVSPNTLNLQLDYFNQESPSDVLAAQQQLIDRRFVAQLRERGLALPVTIHIASEDASTLGRVICGHAASAGAALVVMGHNERSKLRTLLLGSTSEYVAKHAPAGAAVRVLRAADLGAARAASGGGGK